MSSTLEELEELVRQKRERVNQLRAAADARERQAALNARPTLAGGRSLLVWALVDELGGFDRTPDDEYREIEIRLQEAFKNEFRFVHRKFPWDMANECPDIYIIDYGGVVGIGQDGCIESMFRSLTEQIDDHPNIVFMLWSSFTEQFYEQAMQGDTETFDPSLAKRHNVIFAARDDWAQLLSRINHGVR